MSYDDGMARLYLLRHGEVDAAWRGRLYGDHDVPLSAHGEEQARAAARVLEGVPLDGVISSGLARAEFTAAMLRAPRGLERRDAPELRELSRGSWVGRDPTALEGPDRERWDRWWRDPEHERLPGGESLGDLAGRVLPALDACAATAAGGSLALVLHSWVVRVVTCAVLELPLAGATRLELPTGGLVCVEWRVGEPSRSVMGGWNVDSPPRAGVAWYRGPRRA